jgi:hypoxanthine phosphoribosyltransferase
MTDGGSPHAHRRPHAATARRPGMLWKSVPMTTTSPEREILTWELNGVACRELAQQVADDNFVPDIILGIARGGLIPAGSIAYALDCKLMISLNVEFYTGVGETLSEPVMLPSLLESSGLTDQRVLVVDDVADTGKTLKLVNDFCEEQGRVAEVRNAVLYTKPHTITSPDYTWRTTDKWIDFPWSAQGPIVEVRR